MKVFLAGGSGAVGKRLVPKLIAAGHDVTASTRSTAKTGEIAALGATPVVLDALDRSAVMRAVMRAEPEVVIHQLTALAGATDFKRFDREFELTNRLRTQGIDYLLEAAKAAGARRLIAQSYGNWNYARTGDGLKTETDALDPAPPKNQQRTLEAIRYLESAVLGAAPVEGVVLRYGNFYGPGTSLSADGEVTQLVRKRRLPVIGQGTGVWSFIHIDDVASAAVAAVEHGAAGVYNIVDDEPAAVSRWLPELANAIGAKPPRHVPVWLGRLAAGEVGVSMMTQIRGTSNAKAKRDLGWTPTYPTYREGFRNGLKGSPQPRTGRTPMSEFTVTRTLKAPRERVWQVLTQPSHFEAWLPAKSGTAVLDVRTGGSWQATVISAEGEEIALTGRYHEVSEPDRLVMTVPGDAVTAITLTAADGETTRVSYAFEVDESMHAMVTESVDDVLRRVSAALARTR